MKILRMYLHPFAGVADREVEFRPGLNVVCGPNEAGKSTLAHALRCVLFTPPEVGKREWRQQGLERFVPLGGGDTFRVSLRFERSGQSYELRKSWGHAPSGELSLPGGQVVTAAAEIALRLEQLLTHRRGTWQNVLFAYQGQVAGTTEAALRESEERGDLAEILRRATLNTDGVAIEKLGQRIEERHQKAFSQWDSELQRPRDNRGVDNPWKRGVGTLLQAWYEVEELKREKQRTEEYERQLDALTTDINTLSSERDALKQLVGKLAPAVADARRRRELEQDIAKGRADYEELRRIFLDWPRKVAELDILRQEQPKLERELRKVVAELESAKAYEASRGQRRKLRAALDVDEQKQAAARHRDDTKSLSDEQLEQLEELYRRRGQLEAGLAAGKLKLRFRVSKPTHLAVGRDLDDERTVEVQPAEPLELDAGGRIALQHADWQLSVESGEIGFEELRRQHEATCREIEEKLRELDIESLEQAREVHRKYKEACDTVKGLEEELKKALDGETLDSLREKLGREELPEPSRGLDEMGADKARLENDVATATRQIEELQRTVDQWTQDHESLESLLDRVAGAKGSLTQLEEQLEMLQPLPPDVTDVEAFIAEFESHQDRLAAISGTQLPGKQVEQARLQGEAPEHSLTELEERLRDAQTRFEQARREAQAIERVRRVYEQLREDLDSGTLTPWLERTTTFLGPLTDKRYSELDLDNGGARGKAAFSVPVEWLSVGTQACLGLALRLSMASYFLDDREGFLLLDDPLVDLDPDRQAAAVELLTHFAADKQVIVFTCHPRHADLFGCEPIRIQRDE